MADDQPVAVGCEDCGGAYAAFPLDLTLPDAQWERIMPGRQGGGILCARCTVARAADLPGAVAVRAHIEFAGDQPVAGVDVAALRWTSDGTWVRLPDEGTTTNWSMNVGDDIHAHELVRVHNAALDALTREKAEQQGHLAVLEQFHDAARSYVEELKAEAKASSRALDEIQAAIPAWATDTEDVPLTAVVRGCISTLERDLSKAEREVSQLRQALKQAEQERDEALGWLETERIQHDHSRRRILEYMKQIEQIREGGLR